MVIAIIVAVTVATVPILLPALDGRRIRESARLVSTQFASAQSEALARGRPVGVWIERLPAEPSAAMDLYLCEVPQPYAGSDIHSTVTIKQDATQGWYYFALDEGEAAVWKTLQLRPNDLIRFNYRGAYCMFPGDVPPYSGGPTNRVQSDAASQLKYLDLTKDAITNTVRLYISWTDPANPRMPVFPDLKYPYQIFRQPVKSATTPLQLPAGAVIDLFASGIGNGQLWQLVPNATTWDPFLDSRTDTDDGKANRQPIIITFGPSGALDKLYLRGQHYSLTQPIHFLIGKREKLPPQDYVSSEDQDTQAEKHNFRDLENIWVSINPQSGLVSTTEVANLDDAAAAASLGGGPTPEQIQQNAVGISRQFARSAQTMGGR